MNRMGRTFHRATALVSIFLTAFPFHAFASKVTMDDGRVLEGMLGEVANVAENPLAPSSKGAALPIVVIDDGLRRTFIPQRRVKHLTTTPSGVLEKISIPQPVADSGARVGAVGPIIRIEPFDEFGRRTFEMKTADGDAAIVQGITEITPIYTKVQGIRGRRGYVWDMRIATSSIPRETLSKILDRSIDPQKVDDRLKIVNLYLQGERYTDALKELNEIIAAFPAEKERLAQHARTLRQMGARQLLAELEMRATAGQHQLVLGLLERFPKENVAGEILERVKEVQQRYAQDQQQGRNLLETFDKLLAQLKNSPQHAALEKFREELRAELNYNTLPRLGAFGRLADAEHLKPDQKLALAVSGWLMGSNAASENLPLALTHYEVRDLVRQYLTAPHPPERQELLQKIRAKEGGLEAVSKLIAQIQPPIATEPQEGKLPGHYQLEVPSPLEGEPDATYHIQLPPEYDPHRRYPTVVTLNGSGTTPEQQLSWWAGDYAEQLKQRAGQATRQGYIVMAVTWRRPRQSAYQYSAREHAAVLTTLRDACRRFSIDTDRVFLSGHGSGGDAAWDIGLAHPDLWAGVIPIVSTGDRFVTHYWQNAKYVPLYFVAGELDGGKMAHNGVNFDRYLRPGYDTTVVEYLGRGHEHFSDEIQRIFDWMGRRRRDFNQKEFDCRSMRSFDSFFWWLELADFPAGSTVDPAHWPPPRPVSAIIKGKINRETIHITTSANQVTVWLAPSLINLSKPFTINLKGNRIPSSQIKPDLEVLLEDVRTRGERQHPFWCKVRHPSN